ncbi:MAG: TolC family protein [Methylovirgula sp.]
MPSSRTTIANGFVGLSLTAPLNGLQIDQPYVDAKGSFESGRIQLEATEKNLEEQVRTSAIGIDLDWQALEVAEKALGYAATAVAVERQKLALGKSTNVTVQTLEDSYLQAESQNLNAQISYVEALASFDLTLGTTLDTWKISLRDR